MQTFETSYLSILSDILTIGEYKEGRNGVTASIFGKMLEIDMSDRNEFPVLHGRHIFYKGVFGELAAFFRGPKNIEDFEAQGCNYWANWADEDGDIRVDYGNKWIDFGGVNQLEDVAESIKDNPASRRHIVSGWDPTTLAESSLPCCHFLYQWYIRENNWLDMIWFQRSVDMMVGLPSDIVLAAAWNILLANETNLQPGKITMMLGDCHIYSEHKDQAKELVNSRSLIRTYPMYKLLAPEGMYITEFTSNMLKLEDYDRPVMKLEVKT